MSGERSYTDALNDILDAVSKAMQFTQGMTSSQFSADDKTLFAVVRALEIVGEATKKIPAEVRSRTSEIP